MIDDRGARVVVAISHRWTRRQIFRDSILTVLGFSIVSMVLSACLGRSPADRDSPTKPSSIASPDAGSPTASDNIINGSTTLADSGIANPILTGAIDWLQYYVFNRLVIFDDSGTLQPDLAESWEYATDRLSLTLHLARATWHDGDTFTADDVIFTFDTIRDHKTDTPFKPSLQVNGDFIVWEKIDDLTIRVTTPIPFAPLLFNLSQIGIIPEHVLADANDMNSSGFNANPIGTGPYRLGEWQANQYVKLEAFAEYFRGRPKSDGLMVFFHTNAAEQTAALDAGEIDLMFAPTEALQHYEDHPDFTLHTCVFFTPVTLAFNFRHPLLQDVNLRRAIELALDRPTLCDAVTGGRGIIANNQYAVTGPLDRYNDHAGVSGAQFDPEAAIQLLDQRGYAPGSDGVRVALSGERLSFNLITYSGIAEYKVAQDLLKQMLGDVGIEVILQVVDFPTLRQMWASPTDDPTVRALELEEWPHPFEFDPDVYDELDSGRFPPDGRNYMYVRDDEIDRLIEEGRTETDLARRIDIYHQLDRRRSVMLPAIPLYCTVDGWVVSNRVQGVRLTTYFKRYRLIGVTDWWKDV